MDCVTKKFERGVIIEVGTDKEIVWSKPTDDGDTLFTIDYARKEAVILYDPSSDVYCSAFDYTVDDVFYAARQYANFIRESSLVERRLLEVKEINDFLDFDFEKFKWAE